MTRSATSRGTRHATFELVELHPFEAMSTAERRALRKNTLPAQRVDDVAPEGHTDLARPIPVPEEVPAMSASLWDDPAVVKAAAGAQYVRFENVDDGVVGTIDKLGKHVWSDGSVAVKVEFVEDDAPTLTASQFKLAAALFELKPTVGEKLEVRLVGTKKLPNGRTPKYFRVSVTDVDGHVREVDQSSELYPF